MTITEKVAYLKGFMEGIEFDASTNEGKVLAKITEILCDMAFEIEELQTRADDLHDYCDELDSDLGDVEEYLLDELEDDEDDEDEDDEYDDEYDEDEEDEDGEDGEDYDEDEVIEAVCPECGEDIYFDLSVDPEDVICPNCGKHVSFVCDGDCEGCGGCDEDEDEE